MKCGNCAEAQADPWHPGQTDGCLPCKARGLAQSLPAWVQRHPSRTRTDVARDIAAVFWPDRRRRSEGLMLARAWLKRLEAAS